jgi:hypothetical protein
MPAAVNHKQFENINVVFCKQNSISVENGVSIFQTGNFNRLLYLTFRSSHSGLVDRSKI